MLRETEREEEVSSNVRQPELVNPGDRYFDRAGRNNDFILTSALHATHFAFIGLLIGLIQVKYQNRSDSPFETYSKLMTISIIALAFYGLAIGFKIIIVLDSTCNQSYIAQSVLTYVTFIFGGLSSVSLLSVLIEERLCWLVYLIWVILIAMSVYYSFKLISQFVFKCFICAISLAINVLKHTFKNLMGFRSIGHQQQHSNGTSILATTSV